MKNIKLACNWSQPLKELLDENAVRLDYIKTGVYGSFYEDFETMRSLRPILIHGLGYLDHTGMKNLDEVDFEKANEWIAKCDSPHYGLHYGMKKKNITPNMTDGDIFGFMSKQTQIFKKWLDVPLLLENTPDSKEERTTFDHYPLVEAELITKFIIENDVFLLLDVSHAKVAAIFNGWDIKDYIGGLPLSRVKELHINGSAFDENGDIYDAHDAMQEEDYELLEWVLSCTNPDIVTLEYSGKKGESEETVKENLVIQLNRLDTIIDKA